MPIMRKMNLINVHFWEYLKFYVTFLVVIRFFDEQSSLSLTK